MNIETAFIRIIQLIKALLPKGQFVRSVAVLAGGTALGQAIVVLASPILTRLYSPEDFGVLAVYAAILNILVAIASLRYELAIPLPEKDEDAANLLVLSLGIVALMSFVIGLGFWLFGDRIVQWTNTPALHPYLWLFPVGVGVVGMYQIFNYWAVRKQIFSRIAHTKLNQGLGMVVTQIILGALKVSPLGLLIGYIVGRAAGTITLAMPIRRENRQAFEVVNLKEMRHMAVRHRRFPFFSSSAVLLNSFGLQLPSLLLAAFFSPQVVGQFALVQRVFGVPLALVGASISQVYFGEAARRAPKDIHSLHRLFLRLTKRLAVIGLLPVAVLALAGPSLFALVFGSQWRGAGIFAQLMVIMFLGEFVAVPISYTFSVLERQDLSLIWNSARLVLSAGSITLAYSWGWTPIHAVGLYSLAMLIGYLSLFLLSAYAIREKIKATKAKGANS